MDARFPLLHGPTRFLRAHNYFTRFVVAMSVLHG